MDKDTKETSNNDTKETSNNDTKKTSTEEAKTDANANRPEQSKEKKRWGDEELDDDISDALKAVSVLTEKNATENPNSADVRPSPSEEEDGLKIETVTADDTPYTSAKRFEDLNLSPELLKGIYSEMGFEKPSKIQAITLPMILTPPYKHLIAQAHNGSGKTTCFVLGMLSRVDPKISAPQAICVCPTRELALQNQAVLERIGKYTTITSACAVKTENLSATGRMSAMGRRDPVTDQVVIGTPGTLRKWLGNRVLSCRYINIVVFDEADHMLAQDGFRDDSMRILKDIAKFRSNYQILLFSATYDEKVREFAMTIAPNANAIFVQKEQLSLDVIKQYRVKCPDELAKIEVVKERVFPLAEKSGQSIIFVRTRDSARKLHDKLEKDGYKCTSIHGELTLQDRDLVIKEFKQGLTRILISTDVLARGFDQAQVTLVVNFDLPIKHSPPFEPDYEIYLHRIGRSGRFGRKGAAFNLLCNDRDEITMDLIQNYFQRDVPEVPWNNEDAFEAVLKEAGLA
eukprot:TRINITY_DN883_c0_g1_i4.p1 TRINITY_DN883_c0_g1~~TRINITY_DN883_c0_g1_i4.p1  ORF type:complete len:515 (+),score=99.26 TRINITY_DN883_c0_g1_i4:170-1714(+)